MASIIRETPLDADPADVWAALRDFGALHERLAPGFVVACRIDGADTRVVTFDTGAVAREVLVGVDDTARRLAYSIVESPLGAIHHNASAQVLDDGDGRSRFVWVADVLPDGAAPTIEAMMDRGLAALKRTFGAGAARRPRVAPGRP